MPSSKRRRSFVRHARRIGEEQHRVAFAAKFDALIDAGQKAAAPQGVAARRRLCR